MNRPFDPQRAHAHVILIVVVTLCLIAVGLDALVGILVLLNGKQAVPTELYTAAAGATALIGGMLIRTSATLPAPDPATTQALVTAASGDDPLPYDDEAPAQLSP